MEIGDGEIDVLIGYAESQIDCGLSPESVGQLWSFGEILISEISERTGQIDLKLTNVLAWSSGLLGILLFSSDTWLKVHPKPLAIILMIAATCASLTSLSLAFGALRSQRFRWPGAKTWLKRELLADHDLLSRYQLISMIRAHRDATRINEKKAAGLNGAEACLAVSAALVGIVLLIGLLPQLFLPA